MLYNNYIYNYIYYYKRSCIFNKRSNPSGHGTSGGINLVQLLGELCRAESYELR